MFKKHLAVWAVFLLTAVFFIYFQSQSIFGGDAGDLVAAICTGGVAHPAGYPLFTILGRLANLLPFFTPAWRVSLVSSIPGAATVALVFYLIWKISKSKLAALIGAGTLAFSYLFWLYASVPELFSLNNFFVILIIVLTVFLIENISVKKLFFWCFVLGLSTSSHYYSFFVFPISGFFIYINNKNFFKKKIFFPKPIFKGILFFLLGLIPFLYIPLAASSHPAINWENASNLDGFIKLVTRARYGGFATQSVAFASGFPQRLDLFLGGLKLLWQFFYLPGVLLLFFGFLFLFKIQRKLFWLFCGLFLTSLFGLAYTGFVLTSNDIFGLGMYSRFTLPTMVIGAVLMGVGVFYLAKILSLLFKKITVFPILFLLVLFILPLSLFLKNAPKISGLKNDFTAENFGKDILDIIPQNGILILAEDTPVFNSWYVHYCLKYRQDIILPPVFESQEMAARQEKIIREQSVKTPVFANFEFIDTENLSPEGILWRFYPDKKDIPGLDEVFLKNQKIWESYRNPFSGILKWFRPVTLANVLDYYYNGAIQTGVYFLQNQDPRAQFFLEKALTYKSDDTQANLYLGQSFYLQKKCGMAEKQFLKLVSLNSSDPLPYYFLLENAKNCFKDEKKATEFKKLYEEKTSGAAIKLRDLGQ